MSGQTIISEAMSILEHDDGLLRNLGDRERIIVERALRKLLEVMMLALDGWPKDVLLLWASDAVAEIEADWFLREIRARPRIIKALQVAAGRGVLSAFSEIIGEAKHEKDGP